MRLLLSDQPFFGGSEPSFADFAVAGGFAVGFLAAPLPLTWPGNPLFPNAAVTLKAVASHHAVACISLDS